ncbi:hypothetical protein A9Q79_07340 [Methylophaga sp. 42_25_T18]|nr:hypothetical protein A9Q79_07340 [Methylophaga sp. 42_25_T18]OUR88616.1 hypothetical protein A9Q92_02750 [Methylophaga sp. 42_8_T64]
MNLALNAVLDYINKLSLREKLLFLLVFFAVIYSVWDISFYQDHQQSQQQARNELLGVNTQQQELTVAIARAQAQLNNDADPNEETKQAIIDVKHDFKVSQQQLDEKLGKLVSPTKITELLRNLLLRSQGLKLLSLNNEPVYTIVLNQNEDKQKQDNEAQTHLYEHATTIKLRGNYLQLHHYLEELENSPWGLFWDRLEYIVKDYPNAEITLRVHTVSTDQHWIGL